MSKTSNGRVNILGPNIEERFSMTDRIPINGKAQSYLDAMNGNWYDTKLSTAFFSAHNIQILQNGLRAGVYNMSNQQYVIGEQNVDELNIIMRAIFLQYAKNLPDNIERQIRELNEHVLKYTIKETYGEADSYMKYKRDASTLVVPLAMPILSYSNDKQLELKKWF
jgi:hypothetical protein